MRIHRLPAGWLNGEEADELQRLATGKTVLELGAWKGRSTVCLSEVASHVVSVDCHLGIAEVGGEDSLAEYLLSVRHLANVTVVIGTFETTVPHLGFFDLVYIDGNHDVDSVERDAKLALQHSDVLAFHDYDFESVREGIARVFGDRKPDRLAGSVASYASRA